MVIDIFTLDECEWTRKNFSGNYSNIVKSWLMKDI